MKEIIITLAAFLFFSIARCSKYQFVWTVTNPSSHYVSFCVYNTPAEGIENEIFEVYQRGPEEKEIPYRGPMCKRVPPTSDDYLTLAPGESFRTFADIPRFYNISEPGDYEILSSSFQTRLSKYMKEKDPGSVLLPTKLELLQTPVKLDDLRNFKRRMIYNTFAREGFLDSSNPLKVTITPNTTGFEWSYLTYNSQDDGKEGVEMLISERNMSFRGSQREQRKEDL